jgi:hypothetical protein
MSQLDIRGRSAPTGIVGDFPGVWKTAPRGDLQAQGSVGRLTRTGEPVELSPLLLQGQDMIDQLAEAHA